MKALEFCNRYLQRHSIAINSNEVVSVISNAPVWRPVSPRVLFGCIPQNLATGKVVRATIYRYSNIAGAISPARPPLQPPLQPSRQSALPCPRLRWRRLPLRALPLHAYTTPPATPLTANRCTRSTSKQRIRPTSQTYRAARRRDGKQADAQVPVVGVMARAPAFVHLLACGPIPLSSGGNHHGRPTSR